MNPAFYVILGALMVCIAYLFSPVPAPRPFDLDGPRATVAYIVDGDTLDLKGVERRIRIWGIDTPERGAPGYEPAANALKDLTRGRYLTLVQMQDRPDSFGRTVARLITDDGQDIGAQMTALGHAHEFCRYSKGYYGQCEAQR